MNKNIIGVLVGALIIIILVLTAGMYKFNYLASQPGHDVDGNKIEEVEKEVSNSGVTDTLVNEDEDVLPEQIQESPKTVTIHIPRFDIENSRGSDLVTFSDYTIPYTKQVLAATYKKLFELRSYTKDGVWNGLKFSSVSIDEDKVAHVRLSGSYRPAGDLSGAFLNREINAAAFQYPSVDAIKVYVEEDLFDWCWDDMSGLECGDREWIKHRK